MNNLTPNASRFLRAFFNRYTSRITNIRLYHLQQKSMTSALIHGALSCYILYKLRELSMVNSTDEDAITEPNKSEVYFKDIIGVEEYREEIQEIVDYLKNPEKYEKAGAKIPKGILLYGEPGTGKTMLAKALANESNVNFIYKSGAEFEGKYLGSGSNRIRELFRKARKNAPTIIFIDEIDAIGAKRDNPFIIKSNDAINQLLSEMDGFEKTDNIIVIGATNRLKVLDNALLRPGRFDKVVSIPAPSEGSRKKILQHYLNKIILETKDMNLDTILEKTRGFTGADIKNLVNIAALTAVNSKKAAVGKEEFDQAIDRVLLGNIKTNESEQPYKLRTAYNEAGIAAVALLTNNIDSIHKVTISKKGKSVRKSTFTGKDMPQLFTQKFLTNQIQMLMGCRASEEIFFGNEDLSLRCGEYMKMATGLGYKYVKDMNLTSDSLKTTDNSLSNATSASFNEEVNGFLKNMYNSTYDLLKKNKELVEKISLELFKKDTLTRTDLKSFI